MQNKSIETKLEAWLTFFIEDAPEKIISLVERYPEFRAMYQTLYEMCMNTERVMQMFSEELRELDQHTVKYMIEEMQKEIDAQKEQLSEKDNQLSEKDKQLVKMATQLAELKKKLE